MIARLLAWVPLACTLMVAACAPSSVSELRQNPKSVYDFTVSGKSTDHVFKYILFGARSCYERQLRVFHRGVQVTHVWWVTDRWDEGETRGEFTINTKSFLGREMMAYGEVWREGSTSKVRLYSGGISFAELGPWVERWAGGNWKCPPHVERQR